MRFRSCRQPLARSVGTLMAAVGSLRHSQAGRQPTDAWSHERPFAIAHSATRCLRRGMSVRCGVLAAQLGRPTSLMPSADLKEARYCARRRSPSRRAPHRSSLSRRSSPSGPVEPKPVGGGTAPIHHDGHAMTASRHRDIKFRKRRNFKRVCGWGTRIRT